jgi:hypothetical protein
MARKQISVSSDPVVFELTGEYAGQTIRLGGIDFHEGETHVPQANVAAIEPLIVPYGARRKRLKPARRQS